MAEHGQNIIFVLPHLRVNTTSVSRFRSIIEAALNNKNRVIILEFLYPITKPIGLGQQPEKQMQMDSFISDHLISIPVKLNVLQKAAFYFLNKFDVPYWKIINWLHQIVYSNDIFYPGMPDRKQNLPVDQDLKTTVIAFGGPFGIYTYANKIAELYGGRLVLDYRDPWTYGYMPLDSSTVIYKLKTSLLRNREEKLLNKATLITTVSPSLKSFFPCKYQTKVEVFENGTDFDLADLNYPQAVDVFNIVYLGTIYNGQLQDDLFFEAFKSFVKDKDPDKIKWRVIGAADNVNLLNKVNFYGLADYIEITPRVGKQKVLHYLQHASVFLHLRYGNERAIITSKQADYLFFRKPILLPRSDHGDLAESIQRNHAGYSCTSVSETIQVLENLWEKFSNREDMCMSKVLPDLSFTRKEIARRYLERLSDI